jgi:hypothetical protein
MTVPCPHWSATASESSGACAKGLFGGRPSVGVCYKACKEPASPKSNGLALPVLRPIQHVPAVKRIAHGATGIVKVTVGLDKTPDDVLAVRVATCNACPHAMKEGGELKKCSICGCRLWYKLRLASERCPDTPPRW